MADYVGKISNTLYHAADFSAFEPALLRIFGVRGTKIFRAYWLAITKILFVFLFYLCACAYYTQKEGWTVSEAIYFITVTTSTVGYGVLHPTSEASKVFTIFLIIFGIFFILPIANIFAVNIGVHLQNRILSHVRSYFPSENAWISHLNRGAVSITSILACLILGIIVYSANENWSFVTACYFTVITMSTVGYGDVVPTKESTQWFTVFFIILCVLVFATALNTFGVIYGDLMLVRRRNNVFKKDVNIARLEELSNRPQGIDKFDFVVEILTQLELVNKTRDIEPLIRVRYFLFFFFKLSH